MNIFLYHYSALALNSYTHLIHTTLDFPCYYFHSDNSYTHLIHTPPSDNSYVFSGAAGDFLGVSEWSNHSKSQIFACGAVFQNQILERGILSFWRVHDHGLVTYRGDKITDTDGTREVAPDI